MPSYVKHLMLAAALSLAAASSALAGTKASFIKGTWGTPEDCKKLAAVEAGGERGPENSPELLTENGLDGWENGCTFKSVKTVKEGQVYKAKLACWAEPDEWTETETFTLSGNTIKVLVNGETTEYVQCDSKIKEVPK